MKRYDVIIIGAGAAGLMCGIEAGKRGRKVLILDKADKIGKKILISGGGRCNFTNLYTEPDNFLSENPHFCKSALSRYTQWDFIALMESHGLSWKEKSLGQLFCDQKAKAVVEMLVEECRSVNVAIELRSNIQAINKDDDFRIATTTGDYASTSLVIATGGPSIPAMGSTDFALGVAKQFSINTLPFIPALVPFTFSQSELDSFFKDLSGISTDVSITTKNGQTFKEAILFTHRGISGPAVLQASSYWKPGESISIDLFPNEDIKVWLTQQREEHPLAELKTVLAYKLPKRLAGKLCEEKGKSLIDNKPMQQYNPQDLEKVAAKLHNWQLTPYGTEGLRTAEVSLGGIDTNELSSKTMETKKIEGLYFIGEGVDVTGHLGGFNFQWAWASGWCAGRFV